MRYATKSQISTDKNVWCSQAFTAIYNYSQKKGCCSRFMVVFKTVFRVQMRLIWASKADEVCPLVVSWCEAVEPGGGGVVPVYFFLFHRPIFILFFCLLFPSVAIDRIDQESSHFIIEKQSIAYIRWDVRSTWVVETKSVSTLDHLFPLPNDTDNSARSRSMRRGLGRSWGSCRLFQTFSSPFFIFETLRSNCISFGRGRSHFCISIWTRRLRCHFFVIAALILSITVFHARFNQNSRCFSCITARTLCTGTSWLRWRNFVDNKS